MDGGAALDQRRKASAAVTRKDQPAQSASGGAKAHNAKPACTDARASRYPVATIVLSSRPVNATQEDLDVLFWANER